MEQRGRERGRENGEHNMMISVKVKKNRFFKIGEMFNVILFIGS